MNLLKDYLSEVWRLVSGQGLSEHDVLSLLLILLSLQLIVSLLRIFRRRRSKDQTALARKVEYLSIQIADLQSQLSRHLAETPSNRLPSGAFAVVSDEKKKRDDFVVEKSVSERVVPEKIVSPPILEVPQTGLPIPVPEVSSEELKRPASGIFAGLKKTRDAFRNRLAQVFGGGKAVTPETLDELEELLITSDLGVKATARLLEGLSLEAKAKGKLSGDEAKEVLKSKVRGLLGSEQEVEIDIPRFQTKPVVILVVGVNGVGKTTTIGKLTRKFVDQGLKVTLAACDTFRAAAVDQIRVWGERAGVEVVSGDEGVKPTTVLYQAMEKVNARGDDVLIVDTAGRLHTRVNLMNELGSIVSMIEKLCPGAPHEALLVVDATTGQNALEQAREFGKKVKLSGLVVTKLDGTPKGGIVVAIKEELGIPIRYIGVGEKTEDLRAFSIEEFVDALFDDAPDAFRAEPKGVRESGETPQRLVL